MDLPLQKQNTVTQQNPASQTPPQPAVSTPPRSADSVTLGTEDARFIAFAKENIALLAGVASVPLISSALGALKPPRQMDQLTVLSSLLCIIVFAGCFTLRGLLGAAPRSGHAWVKALPGFASLLLVGLTIYQISWFSDLQEAAKKVISTQRTSVAADSLPTETMPSTPKVSTEATVPIGVSAPISTTAAAPIAPKSAAANSEKGGQTKPAATAAQGPAPATLRTEIVLFLSIYPTLILALGLILVTNFTQQTAHDVQTLIEQKLPEQAKSLFERLQLIARFYEIGRMAGQEKFLKIGEVLIEDRNEILHKLSIGMIELSGAEAIRMQQVLVHTFVDSFDAVSCCDLNFWVNIGTDQMSRDYFRLNLEALKRSNKVTRLLIFNDQEIARTQEITAALEQHQQYGIAWAASPYMDLDPSTRNDDEEIALDFALFDDTKVAIYFRDQQNGPRKLRAVFPGPAQRDLIVRQRHRYADLVAQSWLVSSAFLDRLGLLPAEDLIRLKGAAARNSLVTARELHLLDRISHFQELVASDPATIALKECFLFPNCESDIPGMVTNMYQLRKTCNDWIGPRGPDANRSEPI